MKTFLKTISKAMGISLSIALLFFSSYRAEAREKTICKLSRDYAEIGVDGYEKIVFKKVGSGWKTDGIFVSVDGCWEKVASDPLFCVADNSTLAVSPDIVSLSTSDGNTLKLFGRGFEAELSVHSDSPFIDRKFSFPAAGQNAEIGERDIRFLLSFADCERERGFIGSYCEKDKVAYIFSPFPAVYSRLEKTGGSYLTFTQAIDYYGSAPVFRKAERVYDQAGKISGIAVFSCPTSVSGEGFSYHDRIMLSDGEKTDFYDQLSAVRIAFSQMYPLDHKTVAAKSRPTVGDYSVIASGLENELLDDRAQGPFGAMRPYAYSDFGGESFIGLNIYRSMVKYAKATRNDALYDFCLSKSRMFVDKNDRWIEDAYGFGDFFHYARGIDHFSDNDDSEVAKQRPAMGTYKGFERVDALGEVALFTDDADLKEGFLRVARVIHEKMVMEDYCQPVCYSLPSLEPLVGAGDGGSAGGAALWADIMLMASEMTQGEESMVFLSDAVASAKRAARIGFQQMWSILDAPKSVAVSRTVSTLVELYKKTGDRSLVDYASKVVNGLYHFYHYFNQTYSPYCTGGMSGACSIEKQEAAYESMMAVWQVAPLLDYVDDFQLLDMFVQARMSGYYFYPVNGQGLGTIHSIYRTYYEWPESQYVPYEFASGILNDPAVRHSTVDLTQSIFRETKEIYGAGETFAFNLLFDGKAFSVCPEVCCICTSANLRLNSDGDERFVIYNSADRAIDAPLVFRNLEYDYYDIALDGRVVRKGIAASRLANGMSFKLSPRSVTRLALRRSNQAASGKSPAVKTLGVDFISTSSLVTLEAEPVKSASLYRLSVSRSPSFNELNTKVHYSTDGVFKVIPEGMNRIYYRMEAFNRDGAMLGRSEDGYHADVSAMCIKAQDDFGRKGLLSDRKEDSGWEEINTDFRSDGSRGVMNILSEDVGYGVSEIRRTFRVDCSAGTRFEMLVSAIPDQCVLSAFLDIDGKEYVVADKMRTLDEPIYSYPLDAFQGVKDIQVRICTEGYARGCVLECVRFVSDGDEKDIDIDMLSLEPSAASLGYDLSSGVLHIENRTHNEGTLTFAFNTDLSRNRYLAIDVENFSGMNDGAQWKLFVRNRKTSEMLELRNMYEIEGFDPEYDRLTYHNPSNVKYFRSKSGVYMYDVYTMFGTDGLQDYELLLRVSGKCEMDIPQLYLTDSNAQVAVF